MGGIRKNIYFTNDKVLRELERQKNISKYVDNAVLFYIENQDIIKEYVNSITCLSGVIAKK